MLFDKPEKATKYKPKAGETLKSIAGGNKLEPEELAAFNWGSSDKVVVTRALIEQVGAPFDKIDQEKPFEAPFDGKESTRAKGEVLIPVKYGGKDFALEKVHTIKVKPPPQAPAVAIAELDKWFVPGKTGDGIDGEECVVKYTLEGPEQTADKLFFEVYASNYADVSIDNKGVVKFKAIKESVPVYTAEIAKDKMGKRDGSTAQVPKYSGATNAKSGALKPRADDKPKFLNATFSPYTVLLRFYKDEADKEARVKLEPFWPVFEADGKPVKPESLLLKWKVEKTAKLKHGQLVIFDKGNNVVFRRALKEDELKKDKESTFQWDGKRPDGKVITKADEPYRAQFQAHSEPKEEKGVALAAMHTEVRLFVHPDTGNHLKTPDKKLKPWSDPNSLLLELVDPSVKPLTPVADEARWVAKRLYEAGYYPGPLADALTPVAKSALKEFQRSAPKPAGATFTRLHPPDGNLTADTKAALQTLPGASARPIFGNEDLTDIADLAAAAKELANNGRDKPLVLWVNDRHYYTDGNSEPYMMMDYRGAMDIGDNRVDRDRDSITRPALPVAAFVPLLRKSSDLTTQDPFSGLGDDARKKMIAAMAAAVGPLRVDWTFDEIGDDYSKIDETKYNTNLTRTKKWVEKVVSDASVTYDPAKDAYEDGAPLPADRDAGKKYYTNAPVQISGKKVGLRPKAGKMSSYYKAAFTGDDGKELSLEPWKTVTDSKAQAVCTPVHADVGQPDADLIEGRLGRSGVYLHPSRCAGDGYRFRAQVSLEPTPGAGGFPNSKVLKVRYAQLPQAHTAALRNWRKTSYRGYVAWCPPANNQWAARDGARDHYHTAFVTFTHEGGVPKDYALNTLITNAEYSAVVSAKVTDPYWTAQAISFSPQCPWAYTGAQALGLGVGVDMTAGAYWTQRRPWAEDTWDLYSEPLLMELVKKVEKQFGFMKGHLLVTFKSAPTFHLREFDCDVCLRSLSDIDQNSPNLDNQPCAGNIPPAAALPGQPPPAACAGTLHLNVNVQRESLGFAAVGMRCGATWLFFENHPEATWAHEMGHHRHLEHAAAQPGAAWEKDWKGKAPGFKKTLHDAAPNPYVAGDGVMSAEEFEVKGLDIDHRRFDRDCVMSYVNVYMANAHHENEYFCGKCVMRNRGWAVEKIDDPDPGIVISELTGKLDGANAKIKWKTSKAADSLVEYGTTTGYGSSQSDAAAKTEHSVEIAGLAAGTDYHFRVTSKKGTEETKSRDILLSRSALALSNIAAGDLQKTSAKIEWDVDRAADGVVEYGTSASYGKTSKQLDPAKHHVLVLTGLSRNTTYHYRVVSKDAFGVRAASADATFKTPA
jgi:hypothetical protein